MNCERLNDPNDSFPDLQELSLVLRPGGEQRVAADLHMKLRVGRKVDG